MRAGSEILKNRQGQYLIWNITALKRLQKWTYKGIPDVRFLPCGFVSSDDSQLVKHGFMYRAQAIFLTE